MNVKLQRWTRQGKVSAIKKFARWYFENKQIAGPLSMAEETVREFLEMKFPDTSPVAEGTSQQATEAEANANRQL